MTNSSSLLGVYAWPMVTIPNPDNRQCHAFGQHSTRGMKTDTIYMSLIHSEVVNKPMIALEATSNANLSMRSLRVPWTLYGCTCSSGMIRPLETKIIPQSTTSSIPICPGLVPTV